MAIDNSKLARDLLEVVGGKDNVASVEHCATRLRFKLKDPAKADAEKAKRLTGVVTVVEKAGQFQVVIGNNVPEVHKEVIKAGGFENLESWSGGGAKGNILNRLIDTIAGIFPPLLGAMCAGGLIKGLLAIFSAIGVLTPEMGTYVVLNAVGDSVFYFLPVLLGFSAGRKFGGNPYLTALIGASLIYPSLVELAGGLGGGQITFLRIPMVLMNYSSSVIPILFASYLCCKLEGLFRSKLHASIKNFVAPMLCLLLVVPLTLFIIGPASLWLSNTLAAGYTMLPGVLGGIIVGILWQVLVIFGIHWGFIPVMINNIVTTGFDTLGPAANIAAMSQTGAAFGIFLKMKNKDARGMTFSSVISGIFGITEPIIYGITLPRKKPFILGMIGGACGGAVMGAMGGKMFSMGALGVLLLPSTIDPANGVTTAFWGVVLGLLVAFAVATVLNYLTYKDDTMEPAAEGPQGSGQLSAGASGAARPAFVYSPMNGSVIPLAESKDPVHAQEALGKGVMVIPADGKVYAPFDGTVAIVYDTRHAIGLVSDEGVELLIHVGMETVRLGGKYFESHVVQDQRIKAGQLLLEFDIDKLREEGFELESPVIVTNTPAYQSVEKVSGGRVDKSARLLEVK